MTRTDKMLSRKEGHVGHLIFNNPERRNAMSLEMWEATTRLMSEYAKDDSIAFVDSILTGYEKKKVLMERFMEKGLPEQTHLKRSTGFER